MFQAVTPKPTSTVRFSPPTSFTTSGTTYSGWFLGSGCEYRFDWLPGLYWRTEYRFNSYNSKDIQLLGGTPDTFINSEKFVQTVTSSLVWRFSWFGADLTIKPSTISAGPRYRRGLFIFCVLQIPAHWNAHKPPCESGK